MKAPTWAKADAGKRSSSKAARVAALYLCREEIRGMVKTELAAALGVSRQTLDRDLALLAQVAEDIERIKSILAGEQ